MRKTLLYILSITALASCSENAIEEDYVINGTGKTPISVVTNLSSNSPMTRATADRFNGGDKLIAYIQAGKTENNIFTPVTSEQGFEESKKGHYSKYLTFTVKGNSEDNVDHTQKSENPNVWQTEQLICNDANSDEQIFWDDFSSATYDLRESGRGIRLYYGYCYNGGSPKADPAPNEDEGTLNWEVATDQSSGFKTSDLLYASSQPAIPYVRDNMQYLVLPYTHAMSKVTIEVICGDGFESDATKNFGSAVVTLKNMNTICTVTAPTAKVAPSTESSDIKDITMLKGTPAAKTCTYTALITPTVMKAGNTLATIEGVDGNKYTVVLSDEILRTAADDASAWSTKLAAYNANSVTPDLAASGYTIENGGLTIPGVNYYLEVRIKKQKIDIKATIQDWTTVSASGIGEIKFTTDIKEDPNLSGTEFTDTYDLYVKANYTSSTYSSEYTKQTASSIYWEKEGGKLYFRALSKDQTKTMNNGDNVVWGTTAAHSGKLSDGTTDYTYIEGQSISPRTKDVPLIFYHPMAKITINLVDLEKEATDESKKINISYASIQLTNLATSGTIELHEGNITPTATKSDKIFAEDGSRMGYYAAAENGTNTTYESSLTIRDYPVIPQTIGNDSQIIVTLADGTRYIGQLKECLDDNNNSITAWTRGKHYTYTITLSKEIIKFRGMVKDWDPVTGSGNAELDW